MGGLFDITDKCADFIFGFTGYAYNKQTAGFKEHITRSIDAGKPILAKIKGPNAEGNKPFRVIIGYDGDALIDPDYAPAASIDAPTVYDEIEFIYVFGEKVPPKHTFWDVLRFVERIMDSDFAEGLWYDFAQQFDYGDEKLWEADVAEIKRRFERAGDVADWLTNQGHDLQETFGDKELLTSLGADVNQLSELLDVIGQQGHMLHELGYQIDAIRNSVNALGMNDADKWPWEYHGLITVTKSIIESITACDMKILVALKKTFANCRNDY